MIHLYDADIRHVDDYMGRLFRLLEELDLSDRTVVILTSDHGEEFGEHGNWFHAKHLYGEIINVPLIIRLPDRFQRSGRVSVPVSLLDLAPTIAELAGAKRHESWGGTSLLKIAADPSSFETRKVLAENVISSRMDVLYMTALQDLSTKYFQVRLEKEGLKEGDTEVQVKDRQELYKLKQDPFERVNLAPLFTDLTNRFRRNAETMEKALEAERAGRPLPMNTELSEETLEKLRALGYMK
jgi:arylsulfatase A-like enzyme